MASCGSCGAVGPGGLADWRNWTCDGCGSVLNMAGRVVVAETPQADRVVFQVGFYSRNSMQSAALSIGVTSVLLLVLSLGAVALWAGLPTWAGIGALLMVPLLVAGSLRVGLFLLHTGMKHREVQVTSHALLVSGHRLPFATIEEVHRFRDDVEVVGSRTVAFHDPDGRIQRVLVEAMDRFEAAQDVADEIPAADRRRLAQLRGE